MTDLIFPLVDRSGLKLDVIMHIDATLFFLKHWIRVSNIYSSR
jgi:hypothetical protein